MGWTEDRVEVLTKLWMQGLSAAQIAVELGGGVTRNAVIGKVHRLKLSGRVKPATSSARARKASKSPRRASPKASANSTSSHSATVKQRSINSAPISVGATALKSQEEHENELFVGRAQDQDFTIPINERVSLLELTEDKCKWPIGDPLHAEFHFCGRHSLDGKPYCKHHSQKAYHKPDRKKSK